jgi:hypothetical protein
LTHTWPGEQALLQPPQWLGLFEMLVHDPLQQFGDGGRHPTPHSPQLLESVWMLTHLMPQHFLPTAQHPERQHVWSCEQHLSQQTGPPLLVQRHSPSKQKP